MNFNRVFIFGDSYSTFEGYIPEGYATCYRTTGGLDVRDVSATWWHMLLSETNSTLVQNNSWSGSTIGYTGYDGVDCSATNSFIYRLEKLYQEGFFEQNTIDTVFVFGGTNDCWSSAPVGELKYSDWKKEDLYFVLPAICYFIHRLQEILPKANIVCIINTGLKESITEGLKSASDYYNVHSVRLKDIDKMEAHPTAKGMKQIKEQILDSFR